MPNWCDAQNSIWPSMPFQARLIDNQLRRGSWMGSATPRGPAKNGRFRHFFPSNFYSKSCWWLLMTGEHKLETSTPTTSFLCGCSVDSNDNNILMSNHKEERYLKYKMWTPKRVLARYQWASSGQGPFLSWWPSLPPGSTRSADRPQVICEQTFNPRYLYFISKRMH